MLKKSIFEPIGLRGMEEYTGPAQLVRKSTLIIYGAPYLGAGEAVLWLQPSAGWTGSSGWWDTHVSKQAQSHRGIKAYTRVGQQVGKEKGEENVNLKGVKVT